MVERIDVMPNMKNKSTETDAKPPFIEVKKYNCCKSVYVYLKFLKFLIYILLGILFDVAAFVTLKCSSLFEYLSNNLETSDIIEDLTKQTFKNRFDISFSPVNRIEEQIKTYKVNATIMHPLNTKPVSSLNQNIKDEEQINKNKVNVDIINVMLNTESDSSSCQNITNIVNADSVNLPLRAETNYDMNDVDEYDEDDENIYQNYMNEEVNGDIISSKSNYDTSDVNFYQNFMDEEVNEDVISSKMSYEGKNDDILYSKKVEVSPDESDSLKNEVESFSKQEVEKNDSTEVTYSSCVNNRYHMNPTVERNVGENHNNIESKRKQLDLIEKQIDILSLPPEYSLAYCVATDFFRTGDFESAFKIKFGKIGYLMDQHLQWGDVGKIVSDENQNVFYLVVKKKNDSSTIFRGFEISLHSLLYTMNKYKLNKLAISTSGIQKITTSEIKQCISEVFAGSNIEVTLCLNPIPICRIQPRRTYTSLQLWEMESQTDLLIFIDLVEIYLDGWKDEVVENVNARYPFKDKLMYDITTKPIAAGDVLAYKVDKEILFCIFFKHKNPSYYACLEKAFKKIKSRLTGYRYLAMQKDPVHFKNHRGYTTTSRVTLLKTVFCHNDAEIWICGDTENHKHKQKQLFNKVVNDAIEMNKRVFSKSNANPRFKTRGNKYNTNGFDSTFDLEEDNSYHKTSDNTTENWDW